MSAPITIESLPRNKFDTYLWTDFAELSCLIDLDRELNLDQMQDKVYEMGTANKVEDRDRSDNDIRNAEKVQDWFRQMSYRQHVLGEGYPFMVSRDGEMVTLRNKLSVDHKLYLYLLLASNGRYVRSDLHSNLTADFEYLCHAILGKHFPGWDTHIFGSGRHSSPRYSGNIWTKLNRLAIDLHCPIIAKETDYPSTSTGDDGLDIVAWLPFQDQVPGLPAIFAQCACSPDEWIVKQDKLSFHYWRGRFELPTEFIGMTFIPVFYRNATGDWHTLKDIRTVLVDRLRIMLWSQDGTDHLMKLRSGELLTEILDFRQPPF